MPFSRSIFITLAAVALSLVVPLSANQKAAPNVIVITIDTLRADHVGCYGYKAIRTPTIDSLAADGTRFDRAYTPVPVTLPSHSAMFTGTYPTLSGMHDFSGNVLNPQQPTLASVLKENGYATGAVIGSAVLDSRFGLNQGFDFYYDHFDFNRLQESNLEEMERPANAVVDVTLDWLGKNYQKKFFLWMHLYDPHHPYRPPPPYDKEYVSSLYDGEIAFADAQVGRLIAFLKQKGLYADSLIVLSGDHGEGLGEHGEKTHGFFIYNSTLHVPFVIHLPAASSVKQVEAPVSVADLMPTVLAALGIAVPAKVQGQSLVPLIMGKAKPGDRTLYSETFLPRIHFNWSELRGAETANYHFIDAPRPELYDLKKDPGETQNLFPQKKAVGEEMQGKLNTLVREYSANQELAQKTGLDPALMERLKSLGYAGFSGGGDPNASNRDLPDPKDRIELYELISEAISDAQHGRLQESADKLTTALKTEPNAVATRYLLGLSYYRLLRFEDARKEFTRVVELSPDYTLAIFYLGLANARVGDFDGAIASLKRALELDSTNFSAAFNLGVAYLQKKQIPESIAALRQSVTIYPDYAEGHRALGDVLAYAGQPDEAIVHLRRAIALEPDDPRPHVSLARVLAAKGLNTEAEAEMQKSRELHR
jgi:arylsulfatase A-like enzyme/Flp pilus assembly protein TadD